MNIIRKLAERQAAEDSRPLPRAATKRIKSNTEASTEYHPVGYGVHFCFHGKSYYEPCLNCRRTRLEAKRNLSDL